MRYIFNFRGSIVGDHGTSLFLYQLPEKIVLNILPIADYRLPIDIS